MRGQEAILDALNLGLRRSTSAILARLRSVGVRMICLTILLSLVLNACSQQLQAVQSVRSHAGKQNAFSFDVGNVDPNGKRLGLSGSISCPGFEMQGYQRWELKLYRSDRQPFDRDQILELRFFCADSIASPEVIQRIELKQQEMEAVATWLYPHAPSVSPVVYGPMHLEIFADGKPLEGLTTIQTVDSRARHDTRDAPLFFIASEIDLPTYLSGIWSAEDQQRMSYATSWCLRSVGAIKAEKLPIDWRELAFVSIVAIDCKTFEKLDAAQQEMLVAFAQSGNGVIFASVGSQPKSTEWLTEWMGNVSSIAKKELEDLVASKKQSTECEVGFGIFQFSTQPIREHVRKANSNNPLTFRSSMDFQLSRADYLLGVHPMHWTIPEIGVPPVWSFLLLVTMFAVVAGPAIMWWTNIKVRRPVLLLIVFPSLSLLVTAAIVIFSVFSDGFEMHARIRSISVVDADSGNGFAYSRQTTFGGYPPRESIMSAESEVWEVRHEREIDPYSISGTTRGVELRWGESHITRRNDLVRREQQQWIVSTPIRDLKPFKSINDLDATKLELQNLLDDQWLYGVFTDGTGKIWTCENIAAKSKAILLPSDEMTVKPRLLELIPVDEFPPGYTDSPNQSLVDWLSDSRWRYRNRGGLTRGAIDGRLETRMTFWAQTKLPLPGQFLLFLEHGSHLDRVVDGSVNESHSSHMMYGTW